MLTAIPSDAAKPVWIDLLTPDEAEIARIAKDYGIKVPDRAALREIEASSRLRADGDTLYMSVPMLAHTDTERWETAPTGFILSPDVLVTVRYAPLGVFEGVMTEAGEAKGLTPSMALVMLLEAAVDRAADHLEHAAELVGEVARTVFFEDMGDGGLARETRVLRKTIRTIGRANDRASRVRYMFLSMGRMASFVGDRCTPKLEQDINDRLTAINHDIVSLDEFEVSLSGRIQLIQDAATGLISIEQNDVVKLLTVASVVGIPPVLIVGIYGMNFKNMPELGWAWGYPYALGLCVLSAVVPYLWFKWRDWI
ncbi:magnesium transporter CorA family protein [Novosphingobium terrae]|uniref:magnesium transporter CorA family protein n=1 Tax=Novosphingobium terrae TaxID=2726189 RepID=UPI00197F3BBA|nr:magnesium transporter CorA family protein [Novosphingobium terrae]